MKVFVLLVALCVPAYAKPIPETHPAKVISQEVGTYNGGAAVMPMGTALIGIPVRQRSNVVVIETPKYRVTLSEQMTGRGPIILPVNGTVQFYQAGKWVVILDSANKKHKFGIVHEEALP